MATSQAADQLAALWKQLVGQEFGEIRVLDAGGEIGSDVDGDSILRVRLKVTDPQKDETWSLDDVYSLRGRIEQLVADSPVDLPSLAVELYPESPDEAEDESDVGDDLQRGLAKE